MAIQRTELRAFPRLSCARQAQSVVAGIAGTGQIIDIARGGCKLLPHELAPLITEEVTLGAPMVVEVDGFTLTGKLVWATPNCSALGCAFDDLIAEDVVMLLSGKEVAA